MTTTIIDKDTVLSNRYCIRELELETGDGERVYQAADQILGRNVSIFFPSPSSQDEVVSIAKNSAQNKTKSHINVLDISALNSSQIFIVTTTATAEEILHVLKPSPENSELQRNAPATGYNAPPPPGANKTAGNSHPLETTDGQPTGNFSLFEDEDEGEDAEDLDTAQNEFDAEYLFAEEEAEAAETNIPLTAAAAHDFIIPFHTESRPIIDMADNNQEFSPEEETAYGAPPERRKNSPTSWLLGTALVVLVLVLACGGIYMLNETLKTSPTAAPNSASTTSATNNAVPGNPQKSAQPANTEPLEIVDITRSIDGSQDTEAGNTSKITNAITPDSRVWSTLQYSNDNFGGFFKSLSLSLELKEKSTIHEVTIDQQGTTGGMFTVYASDSPTPDATAQEIAQGSFTGPDIKLPLRKEVTAKYVIITFTQLPKLQNPHGSYPYGIRLTQINVS